MDADRLNETHAPRTRTRFQATKGFTPTPTRARTMTGSKLPKREVSRREIIAHLDKESRTNERRDTRGKIAEALKEVRELLAREPRHPGEDTPDSLHTTREAALWEGVSQKTIARRCIRGEYPGAIRTNGKGGHWRIPGSAIDARREGLDPGANESPNPDPSGPGKGPKKAA